MQLSLVVFLYHGAATGVVAFGVVGNKDKGALGDVWGIAGEVHHRRSGGRRHWRSVHDGRGYWPEVLLAPCYWPPASSGRQRSARGYWPSMCHPPAAGRGKE